MNDSTENADNEEIEVVHIKRECRKMRLTSVNLVPHAASHSVIFTSVDDMLVIAITPAALVGMTKNNDTLQFPIAVVTKDGSSVTPAAIKDAVFDCFVQLGVQRLVEQNAATDKATTMVDISIGLDADSVHAVADGNRTFGIVEVWADPHYVELCRNMQSSASIAASVCEQRAKLETLKPADTVH